MRDYPRWLLVIAFLCVTPVFVSPLYLFGGLTLFGRADNTLLRFLLYLLQNLLWVVPILGFFVSLDLYRRGFERWGVVVAIIGLLLAVLSFLLIV